MLSNITGWLANNIRGVESFLTKLKNAQFVKKFRLSLNPKVIYHFQQRSWMDPILSQLNLVHKLSSYFSKDISFDPSIIWFDFL
jgi:hypothetical protein